MRDTQLERYEDWLAYSPLMYNFLSVHQVKSFSQIKDLKWIRGVKKPQSSFRMKEKLLCIAGSKEIKKSDSTITRGLLSIFDLKLPDLNELDDCRLKPSLTEHRYNWETKSPITVIEQFAFETDHEYINNGFAISFQHNHGISLINSKNLLLQQNYKEKIIEESPMLIGHESKVTKICWANANGPEFKLASSGVDGTIFLWDIQKVKYKQKLKYHRSRVEDLCFMHQIDGVNWVDNHQMRDYNRLVSSGNDNYIYIWDLRQKLPVSKINGRQKQVSALACLSHDCLLTGGGDGSIRFWDLKTMKQFNYKNSKQKNETHHEKVKKIIVHHKPDREEKDNKNSVIGKVSFSSSGKDGKIILWQEKVHFVHYGHQSQIASFDRLEDEQIFISAEKNENNVMIWQNGVAFGQLQI